MLYQTEGSHEMDWDELIQYTGGVYAVRLRHGDDRDEVESWEDGYRYTTEFDWHGVAPVRHCYPEPSRIESEQELQETLRLYEDMPYRFVACKDDLDQPDACYWEVWRIEADD